MGFDVPDPLPFFNGVTGKIIVCHPNDATRIVDTVPEHAGRVYVQPFMEEGSAFIVDLDEMRRQLDIENQAGDRG